MFSISKYLGAQLHIGPEVVSVQLCWQPPFPTAQVSKKERHDPMHDYLSTSSFFVVNNLIRTKNINWKIPERMRTNVDNVSRPRSKYTLVDMRTGGRKPNCHSDGRILNFLYTKFHLFWKFKQIGIHESRDISYAMFYPLYTLYIFNR